MRTILFDIDGTLLKAGGIVREAMAEGLQQVFGTRGRIMEVSFIGATDIGVVRSLMSEAGFKIEEIHRRLGRLFEVYGGILEAKLESWDNFKICHGVPGILDALEERGALLGLVTGNCHRGAFAKLERAGLTEYFRFGAFGDETSDRIELCTYAHARAEAEAQEIIPKESIVLVGDAPSDIRAAHEYGIRVLAVASGWIPRDQLVKENPTWLYPDLSATGEIVELLLS